MIRVDACDVCWVKGRVVHVDESEEESSRDGIPEQHKARLEGDTDQKRRRGNKQCIYPDSVAKRERNWDCSEGF